ncbi:MAG: DNA topoisomerase I [Candidatus Ryanbacteria bacterium RIFCSPHIGHO2_02_FULL_48_12]|uniref:DNA topoisomerase 1 n=1 Tax=Candidatus Ryanbacteria bacterium RIFCSPHIGHO2_01_FULL_48_27 TaxID=1802115 RepID=A0A1G2G3W8_9BACT|nr:MAG: DNA topoisomerase I [Candidatus Ryanbacteria bacterium RIFCSPHIGHO2_01_FULL_48_27]OGZ50718.1 MAG: DNA topoisomerase I [Candidatus Ryanbacteria bacterium RIFCSPHIGHO2_02_FULL_48_12]
MKHKLVIVESPTKARTISRFLGRGFTVESSFGHVRDLPSSILGVDVEHEFQPKYVIPKKARAQVKKLKELAKKSETIILATDEDREGEAIAWHLKHALDLEKSKGKKTEKEIQRIVFHEITKGAIEQALEHPRDIDAHLVDAQQARRILDRLVGYKLSPFLWKKVAKGLSAGRVQSVAVRLIVEREREIQAFKAEEYWSVLARFAGKPEFTAGLHKIGAETIDKLHIKSKADADKILQELAHATYTVSDVEKKATERKPPSPFTTSTLQQEGSRRFGFSAKQTMMIAQQLYEGIELGGKGSVGLITYMRTDSLNLAETALTAAHDYLREHVGAAYALPEPRRFKTKAKGAQEAHEAIRPTDVFNTPADVKAYLAPRQFKLYQLIWQRFVATQMPTAVFDSTAIVIDAGAYEFRATGSSITFDGFLKIYPTQTEEVILPDVSKGEVLDLLELKPEQHFTEPPARYSEASLIKILEKNGIGRPSTYAPTISTIQDRGYVTKNQSKRFEPSDIGFIVNDLLVENFPQVVDMHFTAIMEGKLDKIAEGETDWVPVIREFYEPFAKNLAEKYDSVEKQDIDETTDEVCDKCGKPMLVKRSRFGKFLGCSGFPECRNIKPLPSASLGISCPKCKTGNVIVRNTKRGRVFYGCSRYPDCDFALWDRPIGESCPTCNAPLVRKGKMISCSNKECPYTRQGEEAPTP